MLRANNFLFALLLLLAGGVNVMAELPRNEIVIWKSNDALDTSAFEKKGARVENWSQRKSDENPLPTLEVRDALFAAAELNGFVQDWVESEKDLLCIRAKLLSQTQLKAIYPQLPEAGLSKLSQLIQSSSH